MNNINDYILSTRRIFLRGEINSELVTNIITTMGYLAYRDKQSPIELNISSPGGNVDDGLSIIDYMEHIISCPIITVAVGSIASMASIIFIYGSERIVLPSSTIMFHDMQVTNSYIPVNIAEIRFLEWKKAQNKLKSMVLKKTSLKPLINKIFKGEVYLTAEDAIKYKVADRIASKIQ